jgi:hypothetical protein
MQYLTSQASGGFVGLNIAQAYGQWQNATVLTSLRFLMSSGNVSTGVFKLYGIQN